MKAPQADIRLIVVFGLPGTGKTTFAKALCEKIQAFHLSSDQVRDSIGSKRNYDRHAKGDVYQRLIDKAAHALASNKNVVVDATFSQKEWRDAINGLGTILQVPVYWIMMLANEEIIRHRVSKKRKYSDADFSVFLKVRDEFDPFRDKHLGLQSDKLTIEQMVAEALVFINYSKAVSIQ